MDKSTDIWSNNLNKYHKENKDFDNINNVFLI